MTVDEFLARLQGVKRGSSAGRWEACCPAHKDRRPSLSVSVGDRGQTLIHCHGGCTREAVLQALGLTMRDLRAPTYGNGNGNGNGALSSQNDAKKDKGPKFLGVSDKILENSLAYIGAMVAKWDYGDAFSVVRLNLATPAGEKQRKEFRPIHKAPHGNSGIVGWFLGYPPGLELRPLYNLPALTEATDLRRVYVVGGEKCADAAASIELLATTNAGGEKAIDKTDWAPLLRFSEVVILRDNDQAGEKFGATLAARLKALKPDLVVKVVLLPGLPAKGDVVEWLEAHGDSAEPDAMRAELEAIVETTPEHFSGLETCKAEPIAPGTLVRALDRENFGTVVSDNGSSCTVHFVSPTGQTADVELPKSQLVDQSGKSLAPPETKIDFGLISAGEMLRRNYTVEWLIPYFMAALQHMLWGGPLKACKSLTAIAAAVALALGDKFLEHFPVTRPTKVMFLSGESGWPVLQENVRRISRAMGASDEELDRNLVVGVKLPRFGQPAFMEAFSEAIKEHGAQAVFFDCAYRCIPGDNTSNLFAMGELLDSVGQVFEDCKSTLILLHHSPKHIPIGDPLALDNLAFAGFAEFSAQWALLNRRTAYEAGSGHHELWLTAGGRVGHSGTYALDIDEGAFEVGHDREWQVSVSKGDEMREAVKSIRQKAKDLAAQERLEHDRKAIVQAMLKYPDGETKSVIADTAGVNGTRAKEAMSSLLRDGMVVPISLIKGNHKTPVEAYKLAEETTEC